MSLMDKVVKLFTKPLFIGFVIASACNATWLFGFVLPTHPTITIPAAPPVSLGNTAIDRYDATVDNDQLINAEHNAAIETAAGIEAIVIGTIVGASLAQRITRL